MPNHIAPTVIVDGTLYTLLAFSIATWSLIVFKIWQFARHGYQNRRFTDAFWEASDVESAKALPIMTARGPQARIAQRGFGWLNEMQATSGRMLKFHGSPEALLGQALRIQTQKEQHALESGLTLLASIGSTAPFVGLFGTVLGIMHALHEISQSGSASLDVVAGPIGDALIATAIGIAVAVPAVLAYNFFGRRAKQHRQALDNFAGSFLHLVFNTEAKQG
ncbi:MotA/TolQ/ExbB proton channel family protein [Methylomicrobium album]|uniref:Biopolymer transport protein n=1 Tax=Methylomicrobium album BG8 TaxID=686340 RepID=H8GKE0_METAL|nr:MotA/TolQ/ExbB proton channel family protein [Methylomicrobium album]EIC30431.1 biopolymer transport protein [Methylomicrobium album BG8]